jgi:hypothetical protein
VHFYGSPLERWCDTFSSSSLSEGIAAIPSNLAQSHRFLASCGEGDDFDAS